METMTIYKPIKLKPEEAKLSRIKDNRERIVISRLINVAKKQKVWVGVNIELIKENLPYNNGELNETIDMLISKKLVNKEDIIYGIFIYPTEKLFALLSN